jgi:hypothetical protein
MGYRIAGERVEFESRLVRGADARHFEVLAHPWAKDRSAVYFEGRKVSQAQPWSFRVLGASVGCDAKRVYQASRGGHFFTNALAMSDGFNSKTARAVEQDGRVFLVSRHTWSSSGILRPLGLEPRSFESLGRGYCRDAAKVVWVDEIGDVKDVEGADAATFVVDESGASDRHGRVVAGERDDTVLPVEREEDLVEATQRRVEGLFRECLEKWFADFDRCVLSEDGFVPIRAVPRTSTPIPPYSLQVDATRLVVTVGPHRSEATVSGMQRLAGWLHGIALGQVHGARVSVNLLIKMDGTIVAADGSPPRWQQSLDLAYLFERQGYRTEASLLLQRVQRWKPTSQFAPVGENALARSEKLLGPLVQAMPEQTVPVGRTTQAAMQWLVDERLHESPDPLVRHDAAGYVATLMGETQGDCARLARIALPLLALLDDPEPAVRVQASASFDYLANHALRHEVYAETLPIVEALCAHDVNLDMQHARRWECLFALGRRDEAEAAWEERGRWSAPGPVVDPRFGSRYLDFDAWRGVHEARAAAAAAPKRRKR